MIQITKADAGYPAVLGTIHSPPAQLYIRGGELQTYMQRPRLAVVGSRKISAYGKAVTAQLVSKLAACGVVIVSGLAFGVDAIAHRAALEAGGLTIAVLACGVDRIYPASHHRLGEAILAQGGAILSEYPPRTVAYKDQFVARNRIVSGLSDGVLITEAALKSGSLHTARFALEQGREVLAVPGNITSEVSIGTNNLIKAGATPVTSLDDILHALGWEYLQASNKAVLRGSTPEEQTVLNLLAAGATEGAELLAKSELSIQAFNQTLTMLEITGKIRALGNNQWGFG
ncbi:MAG TPA: DNA-processing protein DprA [Candidatus Saccharimonadales bacterium]|nr:DNA-processing protein DprA [Candidatus Saccharimonadales bacterium]